MSNPRVYEIIDALPDGLVGDDDWSISGRAYDGTVALSRDALARIQAELDRRGADLGRGEIRIDPQDVADSLIKILPKGASVFTVELAASAGGQKPSCSARARVGFSPHNQREICGIGDDLATAIVALSNEADLFR